MSERRSPCAWDSRYERVETLSDDGDVIGTRFEPVAMASPVPGAGPAAAEPPQLAARRRGLAIAASAIAIACVVAAVWLVVGT
jgi:hypothetical protein